VTRKGEAIEVREGGKNVRAEGVKMDVADEFFEVDVFLTDDGLVAVLEELAGATVAAVKGNDIASEKSAHQEGNAQRAAPKKEVGMIR
jgi:hypothetical protein